MDADLGFPFVSDFETPVENELVDTILSHLCSSSSLPQQLCHDNFWRESFTSQPTNCLRFGVSCLNRFVQLNFTGPPAQLSTTDHPSTNPWHKWDAILDCRTGTESYLALDGICPHRSVQQPLLLWLAIQALSEHCNSSGNGINSPIDAGTTVLMSWWAARTRVIQQRVLQERSPTLAKHIFTHFNETLENLSSDLPNDHALIILKVEIAHAHLLYQEVAKAMAHLQEAMDSAGMNVNLTGALGNRTRYQQRPVAQLLLEVTSKAPFVSYSGDKNLSSGSVPNDSNIEVRLPVNCKLQDDTVLEKPEFVNNGDATDRANAESHKGSSVVAPTLDINQQCILLCLLETLIYSAPKDNLHDEQLWPFINKLLEFPVDWSIMRSVLFFRCRLEAGSRRRVERSLAQVESLGAEFSRSSDPDASHRMRCIYCVPAEPFWELNIFQGNLLIRLGCTQEALEIFTKLGDVNSILDCYKKMGRMDRAEALIRENLVIQETPQLLTHLADITNDVGTYERAWDLSNQRYGRAMKSLGMLYLSRKQPALALEPFQKAVRTMALIDQPWYNLGYCAMQTKDYSLAVTAYHRCLDMDSDSFDAWNNLAAAYTHLGQKEKAFFILQEALKCDYENWKIWDNILTLAVETRRWPNAINAVHKLLDLGESKQMDVDLLRVMSEVQMSEEDVLKLQPDFTKLFARLTTVASANGYFWGFYATSLQASSNMTSDTWDKYLRACQKSLNCHSQVPKWENDDTLTSIVLDAAGKILDGIAKCKLQSEADFENLLKPHIGSARLSVKSILSRIDRHVENESLKPELKERIDCVRNKLNQLLVPV